ncbi:arginine decarboxylase [Musa troglodytarum]|uniref:Arginine decarboxylase n=1 Tax=Musa troglodytarum TaxID=320322 RepID=A0A9E7L8D5_9LILI|nr:arginine decarboxylase [Musa troglodytarum]
MPALACVDAAAPPPGYVFAWDGALPAPGAFPGGTPTTAVGVTADRPSNWSTDLSASLYRIDGWGAPYFCVNSDGDIAVRPHGAATLARQEIDLMKVVKKATDPKSAGGLGLRLPLLVRLPDVLKHRLESLQHAFDFAIRSNGYGSRYQGVYPVKCNQDRYIVEDVVEFGAPFRFGLEAGSKAELLLAMSCLTRGSPDAFLICNGYKAEVHRPCPLRSEHGSQHGDRTGAGGGAGHGGGYQSKTRRPAGDRSPGQDPHQALRPFWIHLRREGQVWVDHRADPFRRPEASTPGYARLPSAPALPHRLSDPDDVAAIGWGRRGRPNLLRARETRGRNARHRHRRRARHRLRHLTLMPRTCRWVTGSTNTPALWSGR